MRSIKVPSLHQMPPEQADNSAVGFDPIRNNASGRQRHTVGMKSRVIGAVYSPFQVATVEQHARRRRSLLRLGQQGNAAGHTRTPSRAMRRVRWGVG